MWCFPKKHLFTPDEMKNKRVKKRFHPIPVWWRNGFIGIINMIMWVKDSCTTQNDTSAQSQFTQSQGREGFVWFSWNSPRSCGILWVSSPFPGCSMNMRCPELLIMDVRAPLLWECIVIPKLRTSPALTFMYYVFFVPKPVVYLAASSAT